MATPRKPLPPAAAPASAGEPALPTTRPELLVLHRRLREERDAAPLESEKRAHLAGEIARVEVQIARVERAMDPPRI
ncbi:MAG TPA: hypothetical protein VFW20_05680 [Candidatus Limnocylindrales bacterium]|nr:hypothetical protein [Candidatus Limnocylindrales bacterium]